MCKKSGEIKSIDLHQLPSHSERQCSAHLRATCRTCTYLSCLAVSYRTCTTWQQPDQELIFELPTPGSTFSKRLDLSQSEGTCPPNAFHNFLSLRFGTICWISRSHSVAILQLECPADDWGPRVVSTRTCPDTAPSQLVGICSPSVWVYWLRLCSVWFSVCSQALYWHTVRVVLNGWLLTLVASLNCKPCETESLQQPFLLLPNQNKTLWNLKLRVLPAFLCPPLCFSSIPSLVRSVPVCTYHAPYLCIFHS